MPEVNQSRARNSKRLAKLGAFLILSCLVLIIGTLIYYSYNWTQDQLVREVKFKGLSYIKSSVLLDSLKPYINGRKRKEIDLEFLEARVKQNLFVLDATANFSNISGIEFEMKERFPIAFFQSEDGKILYVDSTANLFPHLMMDKFSDMPIITGINTKEKDKLKEAVRIINQMRIRNDKFVYNLTSELNFERNTNCYYIITSDLGIRVNFGKVNSFEEKIFKIEKFWNKWLITKNKSDIKEVDVRWKNQVIIT